MTNATLLNVLLKSLTNVKRSVAVLVPKLAEIVSMVILVVHIIRLFHMKLMEHVHTQSAGGTFHWKTNVIK